MTNATSTVLLFLFSVIISCWGFVTPRLGVRHRSLAVPGLWGGPPLDAVQQVPEEQIPFLQEAERYLLASKLVYTYADLRRLSYTGYVTTKFHEIDCNGADNFTLFKLLEVMLRERDWLVKRQINPDPRDEWRSDKSLREELEHILKLSPEGDTARARQLVSAQREIKKLRDAQEYDFNLDYIHREDQPLFDLIQGFFEDVMHPESRRCLRQVLMDDIELVYFEDRYSESTFGITTNKSKKVVTLIFRGSVEFDDWIRNFQAENIIMPNPGYVSGSDNDNPREIGLHYGFYYSLFREGENGALFDRILQKLDGYLEKGWRLCVTGHSRGGALATLFAFYAATDKRVLASKKAVRVFSFASPFVGDARFRKAFKVLERNGQVQHVRFANANDVVTMLPFWYSGVARDGVPLGGVWYKHCGIEVLLGKRRAEVSYPYFEDALPDLLSTLKSNVLWSLFHIPWLGENHNLKQYQEGVRVAIEKVQVTLGGDSWLRYYFDRDPSATLEHCYRERIIPFLKKRLTWELRLNPVSAFLEDQARNGSVTDATESLNESAAMNILNQVAASVVTKNSVQDRVSILRDAQACLLASNLVHTYAELRSLCRKGHTVASFDEIRCDRHGSDGITVLRLLEVLDQEMHKIKRGGASQLNEDQLQAQRSLEWQFRRLLENPMLKKISWNDFAFVHFTDEQSVENQYERPGCVYGITTRPSSKTISIVFRGAVSIRSWAEVLQGCLLKVNPISSQEGQSNAIGVSYFSHKCLFMSRDHRPGPGKKATNEYSHLIGQVEEYLGKGWRLQVTGHGFGAALATMFAFYAATDKRVTVSGKPVDVFSFGSPRVGDRRFLRAFRALEIQGKLRQVRVEREGDLFPALPLVDRVSEGKWRLKELVFYEHCGARLLLSDETPRLSKPTSDRGWLDRFLQKALPLLSFPIAIRDVFRMHDLDEYNRCLSENEPALHDLLESSLNES